MYYRIHFEPKGAFWCVQVSRWGLCWETATDPKPTSDGPAVVFEPKRFETIDAAETYTKKVGLDKAYIRSCCQPVQYVATPVPR